MLNRLIHRALEPFLQGQVDLVEENERNSPFCMEKPTKYDVVSGGKKIVGAAQRKTKDGFLHQGTISLVLPEKEILTTLLKEKNKTNKILETSFALFQSLEEGRKETIRRLKEVVICL